MSSSQETVVSQETEESRKTNSRCVSKGETDEFQGASDPVGDGTWTRRFIVGS